MSDYLNKKSIIDLFTVIIIFTLDRISKFYVISQSEKNFSYDLFESKFLNINLVWNEGIAFGLLSFDEMYFYNLLTILIIILIGLNIRTNYLDFTILHVFYHKSLIKNIYMLLLSANQIRLYWLLIGV